MADEYDDLDLPDEPESNSDWAKARKRVQSERDARLGVEQENATLKRTLAFAQAGIPLDSDNKIAGYFIKGYDGDLTPEAIKAAATEAGILGAPTPPPATQQDQSPQPPQPDQSFMTAAEIATLQMQTEIAAQQRVAQAGDGAMPAPADATGAVIDAFRQGGVEGLAAQFQALGIPVADEGVLRQ